MYTLLFTNLFINYTNILIYIVHKHNAIVSANEQQLTKYNADQKEYIEEEESTSNGCFVSVTCSRVNSEYTGIKFVRVLYLVRD